MSWHYSQVLVEAYWGENSLDGEPCAQSKSTSMHGMCWSPDKTTEVSTRSRSGMTYEHLTDDRGGDVLSWFQGDFLVRTSALPEGAQDSTESRVVFGPKCGGLLARFDPDTSSLRTPQCLLFEEGQESLETLPNWGSIVDGELWEHIMPEHLTSGTESGLLATPTTKGNQLSPSMMKHPGCREWWRTPNSRDHKGAADPEKNMAKGQQVHLNDQVQFPTPTANEDAAGTPDGKMQGMLGNHPDIRGTTQKEWNRGTLNPTWVEWLMGWPIGFTVCDALETVKSPSVPH